MRISDWSSDVCSSDLRFSEDIDFKLALSAEFEAMSPGQRRTVLSDLKKGLADAWSKAGFVITGTKAGSGNGFIQIDMDYPTVLDGHDALRPHIQRSEEHTSELQSLMRNSYAVLCLKKKTT